MTKTMGDLTLFVATMSNVSSFARTFLNNPKRINVQPQTSVILSLNPVRAGTKQTTTADQIESKQSEAASQPPSGLSLVGSSSGLSLVGNPTSSLVGIGQASLLPLVVSTSFAVATVAAVIGRTAALWNLPGSYFALTSNFSLLKTPSLSNNY